MAVSSGFSRSLQFSSVPVCPCPASFAFIARLLPSLIPDICLCLPTALCKIESKWNVASACASFSHQFVSPVLIATYVLPWSLSERNDQEPLLLITYWLKSKRSEYLKVYWSGGIIISAGVGELSKRFQNIFFFQLLSYQTVYFSF